MSYVKVSIALKINGREVYGKESKEALKTYGRSLQKIAYRKMERLYRLALDWCNEYDRQHPAEPTDCECPSVADNPRECTIICNNAEGCEKRSCPARSVSPLTQKRRMQQANVDSEEPVSVKRFNRLIATGRL